MKSPRQRIEEQHQIALVAWFRFQYPEFKDLLYIIANGENVGARRMARLKRLGLVPGMPDLMLAVTTNTAPGLYIEMKSPTGRLQDSQRNIHEQLRNQKYKVIVCYNWDDAKQEIKKYLNEE